MEALIFKKPGDVEQMNGSELLQWFRKTRNPIFANEFIERSIVLIYNKLTGNRELISQYYKQIFDNALAKGKIEDIEIPIEKPTLTQGHIEIIFYVRKRVTEQYTTNFLQSASLLQNRLNRIAKKTAIIIFIIAIAILLFYL
jgi:hypothetical protein